MGRVKALLIAFLITTWVYVVVKVERLTASGVDGCHEMGSNENAAIITESAPRGAGSSGNKLKYQYEL